MWFLFLRLGLDCEDNQIPIIDYVNNKKIKVKVNKKFYKKWDLDRVRTDKFDEISTSDDYLMSVSKKYELYRVTYKRRRSIPEKLLGAPKTYFHANVTACC